MYFFIYSLYIRTSFVRSQWHFGVNSHHHKMGNKCPGSHVKKEGGRVSGKRGPLRPFSRCHFRSPLVLQVRTRAWRVLKWGRGDV